MYTSWFNQNSSNPFFALDQNSRFINRNNENSISISYQGRFPFLRQQQSRSIFQIGNNIQVLQENSINLLKKQQILSQHNQDSSSGKVQVKLQQLTPSNQCQSQQSSTQIKDLYQKKGLKPLARLIINILNKKKFDSSKYLTEQIEQILMKEKKLSKNEQLKQSKNIRRRIYDALNVMIAANVLGPDLTCIKRVNANSFTKKCALVIGQKNEIQNKISQLNQKVINKKKYLESLRQKKYVIEWGMHKKKNQLKNIQKKIIQIKKGKKIKKDVLSFQNKKINFPVILILTNKKILNINDTDINCKNVKLTFQNEKIQLFSQIDCFQIMKSISEQDENEHIKRYIKQEDDVNGQNQEEKDNFMSFWNEKQIMMMD